MPHCTIHIGDCLESLREMPDESVHCVVTSPPYYGLRDYGHDGQIGLEKSPSEYVAKMVEVFREVRRVLRDDGTLWLNLGDSYAGSWGAQGRPQGNGETAGRSVVSARQISAHPRFEGLTGTRGAEIGLKPKDLMGIPWMVAFALRNDGWYLRSDIIWAKPNPMPESVRDRPTKAHEYIFLLTKSARYFYDAEAIKEPLSEGRDPSRKANQYGTGHSAPKRSGNKERKYGDDRWRPGSAMGASVPWEDDGNGRNKRSVWLVSTAPFPDAHFAVYPPQLIEPCILAGSREGDTVLDPFGGAGTTALTAMKKGRNAILCELNPDYAEMARQRIVNDAPMFNTASLFDLSTSEHEAA